MKICSPAAESEADEGWVSWLSLAQTAKAETVICPDPEKVESGVLMPLDEKSVRP